MNQTTLHDQSLMPHMILAGLNGYSERPCLILGEKVATYREVREETSRFIQALARKGIGKGSRIAIISGNRPAVLYNLSATSLSGCVSTALHPLGSLDDHAFILDDAEIETLVYEPVQFGERAAELKKRCPTLKTLLSFGPSEVGEDYEALAATFDPQPLTVADIHPSDLNTIIYTGGTTGKPKGVLQPYRAAAYMTQIQMAEWEWPQELRFLIATPLSHAAAAVFVPTLLKGGSLHVLPYFTPDGFFDAIEQAKITATFLVPVMVYGLLDHPRGKTADMSSLTNLIYGASPMSPTRLKEGVERWGQVFFQCFGQSEAPMVLTHLKLADHDLGKPERFASCGRPSPFVHIALLDDDCAPVGEGESGEICVRGPIVMDGYHKLDEQTKSVFEGGWLHTGDVGRFDEDGFLYIVDRKKDMIVTGGFNVFPREIEDVISAHPAVAQVAVIGVPEEKWGEMVKAVVVLRPGHEGTAALTAELQAAVKEAKGSVQSPKSVDFVDSLPLSALGKPDKKALRKQYWGGSERAVN